jgi:outer membrane autotransporter protein
VSNLNKNRLRRKAVAIAVSATFPALLAGGHAQATTGGCTSSDGGMTTNCTGTVTSPINVYDAAAAYQPTGGSNSYTPANPNFPAGSNPGNPGYNPAPATVTINLDATTQFNVTATNASGGGLNNDRGLIAANYSNTENPAVNNVVINNAGTIGITAIGLGSGRLHALVGDSQVNTFTVNNASTGTISATQSYNWGTGGYSASRLSNTFSSSSLTYSGKYTPSGGSALSLAPVSALYSDDNTNTFVVNNAGTITATGNFAAGYYGRAETQITNTGTIQNTNWVSTDTVTQGHWAIVNYGGADFATVAGSNPDSPLYNVTNITNGSYAGGSYPIGNLVVESTSALTLNNSGTIKGDILVLDTNPMSWVAALANSANPSTIAASGTNSGPKDSNIDNSGTINGNFYLGSGQHVINNSGTINGNVNVDQAGGIGAFAAAQAGTGGYSYTSSGTGTDANGNACPSGGAGTNDALCAATRTVLASFAGSRILDITNSGAINGNVTVNNTTGDSQITIRPTVTGSGAGSSANTPSNNIAGINGTLTVNGTATNANVNLAPTVQSGVVVKNGEWFKVANAVAGNVLSSTNLPTLTQPSNGLLSWTEQINNSGNLVIGANVNAANVAGISTAGSNALNTLMTFDSTLGNLVQNLSSSEQVRIAAEQLHPETNGAQIQTALNVTEKVFGLVETHLAETHLAQLTGKSGVSTGDPAHDTGFWMQGFGFRGDQDRRNSVDGYSADAYGFALGADTLIQPRTRVGGALSYTQSNIDDKGLSTGNRTDIDSYQATLYGSMLMEGWYLNGDVGLGKHNYDARRIVLGGIVNGSHDAWQYTARVDAGWPIQMGKATVTPVAALTYSRLNQDSYSETGVGALNVTGKDTDSVRSGLGAKAHIPLGEGTVNTALELRAIWNHEFGSTSQDTTASFVDGGSAFTTSGVKTARDGANLGASLVLSHSDKDVLQNLLLSYDAEIKDQYLSHTARLQARFDF